MPRLRYNIDGKGAVKAHEDLSKAIQKVGNEADKTEKKLTKQEKTARRIKESVDPQKRYNRQLEETARLAHKGAIDIDEARKRAEQLANRLNRVGQTGKSAFAGIQSQIVGTLSGIASVSGAIALVRTELEAQRQEQEFRTQTQLNIAQAQQNLRQNTFSFGKDRALAFESGLFDLAKRRGISAPAVLAAGAANVSGTGSPELSLELLEIATRFSRDPAAIRDIAGGLGDVAFTSGITDPKEALGVLTVAQSGARIEETAQVGKQIGKVLAAFTSERTGSDRATGAALLSAFTKGAADPTGEISRTAAINLIDRTKKFFGGEDIKGRFKPEQIDTFNEQLDILFNDRDLAEQFLDTASFRAPSRPAVEKLLLKDKNVFGAFQETRNKLSTPEGIVALVEEGIKFVNEGPLQGTAQTEGTIKSSTEAFRAGQLASISQERREEIIQLRAALSGESITSERINSVLRTGFTLDRTEALEVVRRSLSASEGREAQGFFLTDEQQGAREALENILQTLLDIRDGNGGAQQSAPVVQRAE